MIFVLPNDIDDPAAPSGGNRYDREVCARLNADERPAFGAWPTPAAEELAALDALLADVADGAPVVIDGLIASCAPAVLETHAARLRLVVLVHMPFGDDDPAARPAEARALRAARSVIATSDWTGRRLHQLYALPPDRIHVATPGVDQAPLAPGSGGSGALLTVAVLGPHKGQDVLVEALAQVADRDWTMTCAGAKDRDPAFVKAVTERIDTLGLGGRIHLVGPKTGPALDALYAGADLLVHPSRGETYGMVAAEALARGVPVLGTTAKGLPDAVGNAGTLVPPGDPDALAHALRRWFDEPELRYELRTAARARRDMLTGWDGTARTVEAVFRKVITD
ncbi:glycosyltransferase family 4 protein [Dactylosporangium sp. CS-033363]|uniref:glycosyltransferase family 4 protein n=1 Tax=Dactylosporangium sp. CS-033363 TaxID=3239935 RepID=UPI003D922E72